MTVEFTWQMVVIIPNGSGDFRGIFMVEVLWKTITGVINCRIVAVVQFHGILHCFRVLRVAVTTSLEANML